MIKYELIIILVGLLFSNVRAQESPFFFLNTLIDDGFICQNYVDDAEYCNCLETATDLLEIIEYEQIEGRLTTKRGNLVLYKAYIVQLKIEKYSWYLLRYEDNNSRGWYRLGGYFLNDFHHFYKNTLIHYLKSHIRAKKFVQSWTQRNKGFNLISWDCLLGASKKNETIIKCLVANVLEFKSEGIYTTGGINSLKNLLEKQGYNNKAPYVSPRLYQGRYPTQ